MPIIQADQFGNTPEKYGGIVRKTKKTIKPANTATVFWTIRFGNDIARPPKLQPVA
jgi:hypothetical protein